MHLYTVIPIDTNINIMQIHMTSRPSEDRDGDVCIVGDTIGESVGELEGDNVGEAETKGKFL